jgi:hypothetical protein
MCHGACLARKLAVVDILLLYPLESNTTVTLKSTVKKTTCNINIEVSLFDSSKLVVLQFNSRGLCITEI